MVMSAAANVGTQNYWFRMLYNIACSTFLWEGLPDYIPNAFIERNLIWHGRVVAFEDELEELQVFPFIDSGIYNAYALPTTVQGISYNGYLSRNLTDSDSVIIWDDIAHSTPYNDLQQFADRMYNAERACDVNVNSLKTPVILRVADEGQRLTTRNFASAVAGNVEYITVSGAYDSNSYGWLTPNVPVLFPQLQEYKRQIFSEALGYLGIETNMNAKVERQLTGEINMNLGYIEMRRNMRLSSRQLAADQINDMFGTNISVRFNSNLSLSSLERGEDNVNLYNNNTQLGGNSNRETVDRP